MAQRFRILLPMQGTQVPSLVWEDRTCRGATKLSLCATTTEPTRLEPVLCNERSHRNAKPAHSNEDPTQSKIIIINFLNK